MSMELWIVVSVAVALVLGALVAFFLRRSSRETEREEAPPTATLPTEKPETISTPEPRAQAPPTAGAPIPIAKEPSAPVPAPVLSDRLSRTRGSLFGKLGRLFGMSGNEIATDQWQALEEALLEGDVGVTTTNKLLDRLKQRLKESTNGGLRGIVQEESELLLSGLSHGMPPFASLPKPYVISVVGVNGAGKTTTIGKLSHRFSNEGRTVLLGAIDTFRAAAISQLKVWAERTEAQFVTGREGGDPGAVAFDSVTAGKARGIDIVLLDTAGRLHTKSNLMEELKKVHRVVKKVIPEAPHETWLVLDGTAGQNAVQQAREFQKTLDLTGVIVTKLDGTAKGGAILSIAAELKLPIKFIGVGEGLEDLVPFEPKPFVEAILGQA